MPDDADPDQQADAGGALIAEVYRVEQLNGLRDV